MKQPARLRAEEGGSSPTTPGRATRTYTGADLERRKAWGAKWAAIHKAIGQQIRETK